MGIKNFRSRVNNLRLAGLVLVESLRQHSTQHLVPQPEVRSWLPTAPLRDDYAFLTNQEPAIRKLMLRRSDFGEDENGVTLTGS